MTKNLIVHDGRYPPIFSLPMILFCTWDVTSVLVVELSDCENFGTFVDRGVRAHTFWTHLVVTL